MFWTTLMTAVADFWPLMACRFSGRHLSGRFLAADDVSVFGPALRRISGRRWRVGFGRQCRFSGRHLLGGFLAADGVSVFGPALEWQCRFSGRHLLGGFLAADGVSVFGPALEWQCRFSGRHLQWRISGRRWRVGFRACTCQ